MAGKQEESVRMKFKTHKLEILNLPSAIFINRKGVYLHNKSHWEDVLEGVEKKIAWAPILTPKLIAKFAGNATLFIGSVKAEWFDSRKDFETIFFEQLFFEPNRPYKPVKEITFHKAVLDHLYFDISCNLDYYKVNPKEVENDICKRLESFGRGYHDLLEKELYFATCIKIFGNLNSEKENSKYSVILNDFSVLHNDGNDIIATAKLGNDFIFFVYQY